MNYASSAPPERGRLLGRLALLLPHAVLSLLLVLRHEPWRDETHAWLLARGPAGLGELLANIRVGEVSPPLWHLLLRALSLFSDNFLAVSLLHWAMMVGAIALLVWCSPFRWHEQLLISLGYYFVYEYAVIARHYGLSVLLVFAFLAVHRGGRFRLLPHLLLALLAQTNLFGLCFALLFWTLLLARATFRRDLVGHTLVALSLAVAAYYLSGLAWTLAGDGGETSEPLRGLLTARAGTIGLTAISSMGLQPVSPEFWWPRGLLALPGYLFVSAAVVAVLVLLLAPRDAGQALRFWLGFAGLTLLLAGMRGATGARHYGFLLLLLIAFLWLAGGVRARARAWCLTALLLGSVLSSAAVFRMDSRCAYSGAWAAARAVRALDAEDGPGRTLWATYPSGLCEGILAFLPDARTEFFSLELQRPYRYLVHDDAWKRAEAETRTAGGQEVLRRLVAEVRRGGYDRAYFILAGEPMTLQLEPGLYLQPCPAPTPPCVYLESERFAVHAVWRAVPAL